ncbi:MAG: phage head-tail connector protein [Clostridia bacterium]|nr:phage head-tail connector protein [Clostridia bacterium]
MDEVKAEALSTLKLLLGIKDSESDDLLSFLIDDTVNLILGYCRIDTLPRQLESLLPVIAAEMYRRKGYGSAAMPDVIKSISEGERSVTYADNISETDLLTGYYKRLGPYVNRKGRVPSDVKSV